MNKIIFSLLFTFAIQLGSAQESEHLSFKGVPIDGTLHEFVTKMKTAGFSYLGTQDEMALLQGDFAGYKNCTIGVSTLKAIDTVNTIGVIFPECNNWSSLENCYEYLKAMLTQKYGEPEECVEKFQGQTIPETNNDKLHELNMDRCTWFTTYATPKGDIQISLKKYHYGAYFVLLKYYDRINTNSVKEQAINDL